jgi:hypothetical protein
VTEVLVALATVAERAKDCPVPTEEETGVTVMVTAGACEVPLLEPPPPPQPVANVSRHGKRMMGEGIRALRSLGSSGGF